jgi:pyruvate/2-oxoglutarate dehydrogenase complex dihydrolipoamide acyltransferase (E2) component
MTVAPQAETEVVSGTIAGITQKGTDEFGNPNRWQVAVQPPGSQYSKNLWTKDPEMIGHLSTMVGQQQSFLCGISHWNRNDGTAVRSLWINGIGPAAAASPQQAQVAAPAPAAPQQWSQAPAQMVAAMQQPQQQAQPAPQQTPEQWLPMVQQPQQETASQKEDRIHRQTASKVAAILLGYLPAEQRTFDTLLLVSQRLVRYYEAGLIQPQHQDGDEHGGDDGSGIPF